MERPAPIPLSQQPFPELAARLGALYSEEEDALLLAMLGQEYIVRHSGIILRGQRAPEAHEAVIGEYLTSRGSTFVESPWRSIGDLPGGAAADLRRRVEEPLSQHAEELITRAGSLLPLFDAERSTSLIGSDLAITVRALPKIHLRVELSRENQEFPSETWVLFSSNADEFLSVPGLHALAELMKERVLSLLRIY